MNPAYHQPLPPPGQHPQDMTQQMPGGYAPPPAAALHAYPHQPQLHQPQQHPHPHQHHQPPQHLPPPPAPPSAAQHQHQHHQQHPLPHPLPHSQQPHPSHPQQPPPQVALSHAHHHPPPSHLQHHPPPGHGPVSEDASHEADRLAPVSRIDESTGRKYFLDVVQQPRRARMCGFGDKDRRPITPPPCVRLIVTDMTTGKEIDCNELDHAMFVLNVDLWSENGTSEVNLVRSSQGTPSISSTTPFSYSTLNGGDPGAAPFSQPVLPSSREPVYAQAPPGPYGQEYQSPAGYAPQGILVSPSYPPNGTYGPPRQYFPQQGYRPAQEIAPLPSQANIAPYPQNGAAQGYAPDQGSSARMATMMGGQTQGMYTRNLIGSLAASAFRLHDTTDHIGIWFVLQDLSVRTEGTFRLRFSFVNVGPVGGASQEEGGPKVNTGRAPIMAEAYSDAFTVYSAKKFPGVCESTDLSKCFATQGIKIPIRKDASLKGGDDDDDYGD